MLYLLERAWCPLGVLGTAVETARCGAFDDDLEVVTGLGRVNPDGTDTAPGRCPLLPGEPGADVPVRPEAARHDAVGLEGLRDRREGRLDADQPRPGRAVTTVRSPAIALPATAGQRLTFRYVFAHDAAVVGRRFAAGDRRGRWRPDGRLVQGREARSTSNGVWRTASIPMDAFAGQTVRVRFVAADGGDANLVEVEIDDVRVTRGS